MQNFLQDLFTLNRKGGGSWKPRKQSFVLGKLSYTLSASRE